MTPLILNKPLSEHHCWNWNECGERFQADEYHPEKWEEIYFQNVTNEEKKCWAKNPVRESNGKVYSITTSYFVGADWLIEPNKEEKELAIYVEPKLNSGSLNQTNYLKMLFSALKHPEVALHTSDLYEIKWNKPQITITHQQDILTPLLVIQFLSVVKEIVRKGLKFSYYKVENNLYSRIKGKVLVGATIKSNVLKNKPLNTWCSYDEFGLNGLENRLLKKALVFVQSYLPTYPNLNAEQYLTENLNYILPAFEFVTEEVNGNEVKYNKVNIFHKEYAEGLRLAKLILKRFGYNITNAEKTHGVLTPPFWIDMSKLFELYVLGLLKDRFGNEIQYHFTSHGNELDYLLKTNEEKYKPGMVIDAKYKPIYQKDGRWDIKNIRQLSGYARLESVYNELHKNQNATIDCLIIYPDQEADNTDLMMVDNLIGIPIQDFVKFYKIPVKLPVIKLNNR
ncbi:MAG: 5-methylcytosine restriction system specificity protein McrC [Bacteroidia bacterium]